MGGVAGDAALGVAGEQEAGSDGTPAVVAQMLLPGLPRPCIAASAIIARAHSLPLEARQAPPKPPMPPAASMVVLEAHSRASARISRAGTPHSASAHSGVLGLLSLRPSTYPHSSNPWVCVATYSLS